MARINRDFVVKQGIKVATGVTFPDNTVQTTAFTGAAITVGASFPVNPANGAMHLDTNTNRIYYFYNSTWSALANYDDTSGVTDHTHNLEGFVDDVYQYQGNGPVGPWLGTSLDGGTPATTSFTSVIDGGTAA